MARSPGWLRLDPTEAAKIQTFRRQAAGPAVPSVVGALIARSDLLTLTGQGASHAGGEPAVLVPAAPGADAGHRPAG